MGEVILLVTFKLSVVRFLVNKSIAMAHRKKPTSYNKSHITEEWKRKQSQLTKEGKRIKREKLIQEKIQNKYNIINMYDLINGIGSSQRLSIKMKGVFSLNWFIDKHGEIEGIKKYNERCARIKETTHFKIYNKLNRNNYSKISQELFWNIYNRGNLKDQIVYFADLNHEYGCGTETNFDFVVVNKNKIIEFNGDKFHANPKIYSENQIPIKFEHNSLTAKEIWAKDDIKIEDVKNKGYEILIVWESEYLNDKENIIKKCIDFLNN